MRHSAACCALFVFIAGAPVARAAYNLTVSSGPTANVTAVSGTYTAVANDAVLNVTQLLSQLNAGNATLSTGAGGSQAGNISFSSVPSYTGGALRTLTINAANNITFAAPLSSTNLQVVTSSTGGAAMIPNNTSVSSLTTTGAAQLTGNITATNGNMTFGTVTLAGATTLYALAATRTITFNGTINGAQNLSINSTAVAFNGNAGTTTPLNALMVSGTTTINGVSLFTAGVQLYLSKVTVSAASLLSSSAGNLSFVEVKLNALLTLNASGTITFNGLLNGNGGFDGVGTGSLTMTAAIVQINYEVGITNAVAALTINGTVRIAGGYIGADTIHLTGTVELQNDTSMFAPSITLNTVTNLYRLRLTGTITINGTLGVPSPLLSFDTTGPVTMRGVNASEHVVLNGATTLNASATFSVPSGTVEFRSRLNGGFPLTVSALSTTFLQPVGNLTPLQSLATTGSGTVIVNSPSIHVNTSVSFAGPMEFGADLTVDAPNTFLNIVNGAHALTLNSSVNFQQNVGASTRPTSISVSGPAIFNGSVSTEGPQSYSIGIISGLSRTLYATQISFSGGVSMGSTAVAFAANRTRFNGGPNTVAGTGALAFGPLSPLTPFGVATEGGLLDPVSQLALADGFSSLTFGYDSTSTPTHPIGIGASTWKDPVVFRASAGSIAVIGAITRAAGATFSFNAPVVHFQAAVLPIGTAPWFAPDVAPPGPKPALQNPGYHSVNTSAGVTTSSLKLSICPASPVPSVRYKNGSTWPSSRYQLAYGCPVVTLDSSSAPTLSAAAGGLVFADGPGPEFHGDFDGDNHDDLLLRDTATDAITIRLMNGATILGEGVAGVPTGYDVAGIGDFDGDGRADILLRDALGNIGMWFMSGVTIAGGGSVGSPGAYEVAGVADCNGDARADILLLDGAGNLGVWIMNGSAITSGGLIGSLGSYVIAGTADFNGDARSDIALRDSAGTIGIWFLNGATLTSGALVATAGDYSVVAAADFNGDNMADMLLRDAIGNVGMWQMNGSAIVAGALVGSPGDYGVNSVGDYDASGRADVLLRRQNGVDMQMWFMNGSTISSTAPVTAPATTFLIR